MADITKLNLYELFGIPDFSDASLIRKAYHKKALTCHPDKNPDDSKAAEKFRRFKQACSILLDEKARSDYDKVLKSRQYHSQRYRELDNKRQKLRDELEHKERNACNSYVERESDLDAQIRLQQHIERIRREGSKLLDEENQKLNFECQRTTATETSNASSNKNIQVSGSGPRISARQRHLPARFSRHTHPNKLENALSDEEYENLVITKLRQAQQLKRLSLN